MASQLNHCYNTEDLRCLAKKKLPLAMYQYIAGFAEDGVCEQRNRAIFARYELVPRMMRDVTQVDISTTVLGEAIDFPVILGSTALSRLFHTQGERAVARAAGQMNTLYSLSNLSSVSMEEIADIAGPKWFQLYFYKDRSLVKEFIVRAAEAGYKALCLTVDTGVPGNREQDLRNGFTIPPRLSLGAILETIQHPQWLWNHLTSKAVAIANVNPERVANGKSATSLLRYVHEQLLPAITWKEVEWVRNQWKGPLIIKGIMHPEDAVLAANVGADGVVLSNHGGRQLDHASATLDMLPLMVDAVGDRLEILMDSGIRRGTDVAKALALGARACLIGRPYLYGLSAGGEAGVLRALEIFKEEFQRTLQLLGCVCVSDLNPSYLRKDGDFVSAEPPRTLTLAKQGVENRA